MAGKPTLNRSKRYRYFHVAHRSEFAANEVMHAKGELVASAERTWRVKTATIVEESSGDHTMHPEDDLIASPDGTFHVKAPSTDFNDKPLTGVQGGNVLHCHKYTLQYSDMTASNYASAGASQVFNVFMASKGFMVTDIIAHLATRFWCATVDGVNASTLPANASSTEFIIGDSDDEDGFCVAHQTGNIETAPNWFYENWTTSGDKGTYLMNASGHKKHKIYTASKVLQVKMTASHMMASTSRGKLDIYVYGIQAE